MSPRSSLFIAILVEVAGTTSLKYSDGFTRLLPSVLTVLCYGASFYFLSLALRGMTTGVAYAIWSGVGIALISAIGWLFQGQKLDAAAVFGIVLIVGGLTFLPSLALGPIADHLAMIRGQLF